jgi:hypothetical protein
VISIQNIIYPNTGLSKQSLKCNNLPPNIANVLSFAGNDMCVSAVALLSLATWLAAKNKNGTDNYRAIQTP